MENHKPQRKPIIRHLHDIETKQVPCGESRRLITRADTPNLGVHVTHITNGDLHYHNHTEETYYVIRGEGTIELDGEQHALTPGTAVWIPPGVKHRSWGDFETMVITSPAFDPEDEIVL
ncbi:MAG: cupin domain-containing protein [Armatimonadota bacterium]